MAQGLSLNLALTNTKGFGKKTIQSYEELNTFFNEVSDYVKNTPSEDYTIDDFGEVFINHKGKTYPIITGTGHTQVYSEYKVIPYMVTNKLFLSRYKKVNFPIVAYDELKQILKQDIDE